MLQRAFDALCHSTHLYGRRLVLEWANVDELGNDDDYDVAAKAVAAKTAQKFSEGKELCACVMCCNVCNVRNASLECEE